MEKRPCAMKTLLRLPYRIYYCTIAVPLFVLATILLSSVAVAGCALGGRRIFGYWPGVFWSRIALAVFLCPTRIVGRENIPRDHRPCVVMANHQGAFDIFMMYGLLPIPFRWVMKESLRKVPFMGKACQMAGFIFVDDKRVGSIKETMTCARQVLSEGTSIFIFPEGSRTLTGRMDRFKKGGFVLAHELEVPIIPVSIDGSYRALKAKSRWVNPTRLTLTIHPAIQIDRAEEFPRNMLQALTEVRTAIASALPSEQEVHE